MNLPMALYTTKKGPVHDVLLQANNIVSRWLEHDLYDGTEDMARKVVMGWAYFGLVDRITKGILETLGYDVDELEAILDSCPIQEEMDEVANWERRGPTLSAATYRKG